MYIVLRVGLEPTTLRSSGGCSSQLSYLSNTGSIHYLRIKTYTLFWTVGVWVYGGCAVSVPYRARTDGVRV